MSNERYNLIMHSDPEFWSGNEGYVDFPKARFLEHTEDHIKDQFQSLDQNVIEQLKTFPTLFAVEHEYVDTRIGNMGLLRNTANPIGVGRHVLKVVI